MTSTVAVRLSVLDAGLTTRSIPASFLVLNVGSAGLRLAFVLFSLGGVHFVTASLRRLLSSICRWSTGLIVLTEEYLCTSLSAFVGVRSVSTHCFGDSTDDSGLHGDSSSATSSTTSSPPASVAPASTFSHLNSTSHSFAGVLEGSSREGGT